MVVLTDITIEAIKREKATRRHAYSVQMSGGCGDSLYVEFYTGDGARIDSIFLDSETGERKDFSK